MHNHRENGASLIIVLMTLVIVSLLGVGGAQIALMSERGARNDRDQQVAWQAAESALLDAEIDISDTASTRNALFDSKTSTVFLQGCGSTGTSRGLCGLTLSGKPAWLTVDFSTTGNSAATTALGTFTNRIFAAGGVGIQPSKAPRYVIELTPDPESDPSEPSYLYRITAMGFGPRDDIQSVLQTLYRK